MCSYYRLVFSTSSANGVLRTKCQRDIAVHWWEIDFIYDCYADFFSPFRSRCAPLRYTNGRRFYTHVLTHDANDQSSFHVHKSCYNVNIIEFLFVKLLVRQPPGLPDLFLRPWSVYIRIYRVKWCNSIYGHESHDTIAILWVNMARCVELKGEDLSCYSDVRHWISLV